MWENEQAIQEGRKEGTTAEIMGRKTFILEAGETRNKTARRTDRERDRQQEQTRKGRQTDTRRCNEKTSIHGGKERCLVRGRWTDRRAGGAQGDEVHNTLHHPIYTDVQICGQLVGVGVGKGGSEGGLKKNLRKEEEEFWVVTR